MVSSNSLKIEIIEELGRTVKTTNITDNETTISIVDLRPGIYYCIVSGEDIVTAVDANGETAVVRFTVVSEF